MEDIDKQLLSTSTDEDEDFQARVRRTLQLYLVLFLGWQHLLTGKQALKVDVSYLLPWRVSPSPSPSAGFPFD